MKSVYSGGTLDETQHVYYSSGAQALEERVDSSSAAEIQFVWNLGYVDDLVLRDRDTTSNGTLDERLYSLPDLRFSVMALTDGTGTVVERFAYDAYGSASVMDSLFVSRSSSSYDWEFRYTGRREDLETGLYYFRARIYSAQLGRFISRDPLEFVDGMNLYRAYFVPGGVDPSGLDGGVTCGITGGCDDDALVDDDDDLGSICGGPDWRDWGWAIGWGCGRDRPLVIDGDILDEYRNDNDVRNVIRNFERELLGKEVDCGYKLIFIKSGKKLVDLQDTIYSLGHGFLNYSAVCTASVDCEECCDGSEKPKRRSVSCDITYWFDDSWENPVGNRMDWTVNWWRDNGFPIRGRWEDKYEDYLNLPGCGTYWNGQYYPEGTLPRR